MLKILPADQWSLVSRPDRDDRPASHRVVAGRLVRRGLVSARFQRGKSRRDPRLCEVAHEAKIIESDFVWRTLPCFGELRRAIEWIAVGLQPEGGQRSRIPDRAERHK